MAFAFVGILIAYISHSLKEPIAAAAALFGIVDDQNTNKVTWLGGEGVSYLRAVCNFVPWSM